MLTASSSLLVTQIMIHCCNKEHSTPGLLKWDRSGILARQPPLRAHWCTSIVRRKEPGRLILGPFTVV